MAIRKITLLLLSIICLSNFTILPVLASTIRSSGTGSTAKVMEACKRTRYPPLCYQCLSSLAHNWKIETPHQLAQAALSVALYKATRTRAYMMKVAKELKAMNPQGQHDQPIQDCISQLSSGVYQMTRSLHELRRLGQGPITDDFYFHMSNIESWVGSTITDAMMCLEEFPGRNIGKVKATIKGKVLNVAMTASNALGLFHSFAQKYAKSVHMP